MIWEHWIFENGYVFDKIWAWESVFFLIDAFYKKMGMREAIFSSENRKEKGNLLTFLDHNRV